MDNAPGLRGVFITQLNQILLYLFLDRIRLPNGNRFILSEGADDNEQGGEPQRRRSSRAQFRADDAGAPASESDSGNSDATVSAAPSTSN